jgi:hypothetical protein
MIVVTLRTKISYGPKQSLTKKESRPVERVATSPDGTRGSRERLRLGIYNDINATAKRENDKNKCTDHVGRIRR